MSARLARRIAIAFAAGLALASIPLLLRRASPPPPPAPAVEIAQGPSVVARLDAGYVRWSTSSPAPTALWLWEHGQDPQSGREVRASPAAPAVSHALTVRGLRPRAQYRFRLALSDGRYAAPSHDLRLRDVAPRVDVRYEAADLLRVYVDESDELTPGVALVSPDGRCTFRWSERRGPGAIELVARIPDAGQKYKLHVVHRELDDPDVCPRTPHPVEVAGLERFAGWLAVMMGETPRPLSELACAAIDAARREYPVPFGARPSDEARRRLPVPARTRALQAMERVARAGLRKQGLDPFLIASALPLLAASKSSVDRRLAIAAALRLGVLDSAADVVAGRPLFDFARSAFLPDVDPAPSRDAFRPVLKLEGPAVRKLREFPAIPLLTRPFDPVTAVWTEVDAWADAARELTGGTLDPSSTGRGPWHALGTLPAGLAPERGLRVHARFAALEPPSAFVLRIGSLELPFRTPAALFRGFLAPPGPERPPLDRLSTPCAVEVPAGILRPDDTRLRACIDSVPDRPGAPDTGRAIWLTDLAIESLSAVPSTPTQEEPWRPASPSPSSPSSPAPPSPGAAR